MLLEENKEIIMKKELIVVGDRVLIKPDDEQEKTNAGLYLPQGVAQREKIQSGKVVKTGPGIPMPDPQSIEEEPWKSTSKKDIRYMPLQAKEGDHAIFLRSSAVEIEFEGISYLIVPHSAILVLVRDKINYVIKEIISEEEE
ncbi:MAG: co-chaperone GroES [Candidatus Aureabacteria bacterium]|nr:co-chaperone GroES [Candidatus Auribacterota bacterium]